MILSTIQLSLMVGKGRKVVYLDLDAGHSMVQQII